MVRSRRMISGMLELPDLLAGRTPPGNAMERDLTAPTTRSGVVDNSPAHGYDPPARAQVLDVVVGSSASRHPVRASRSIRALGWVMAAWCLGFAAVNVALQITGRFASGPYAELAAGLAVMDWIVVGLKLLGAAVAILSVTARASTAVRTVLIWGAFALLGIYSAGNVVELIAMMLADAGAIEPRSLTYIGFFLVGAAGYGALAASYSARTRAKPIHAVLGVLGAPVMLGMLLVAAPAALTAIGLLPNP